MAEQYDLVIIGGGPGGYTGAIRAAELGMKVAVAEKQELGGTYLNWGCIGTKALLHTSGLYHQMQDSDKFGIHADRLTFNVKQMYQHKNQSMEECRQELAATFKRLGIRLIKGTAALTGDRLVEIDTEEGSVQCQGRYVLIATGAVPRIPDIPGKDLPGVITSKAFLEDSESICDNIVIIGGGVVGVEIANLAYNLGVKATIVEAEKQLLPLMDSEIADAMGEILKDRGIQVYTGAGVKRIVQDGDGLLCYVRTSGWEEIPVPAGRVLMAAGRVENTAGLFQAQQPERTDRGTLKVDHNFMTSLPGVYAVGDVIEGIQLAHVASSQATYVVERMNDVPASILLSVVPSSLYVNLPIIPSCLYVSPEIACVGISENEAREQGVAVRCGTAYMKSNSKAIVYRQRRGFIKVIFAADSDELIGAQMVCARATDMIGELATAIAAGLTGRQLLLAMRAHPTFSESIAEAVRNSRQETGGLQRRT